MTITMDLQAPEKGDRVSPRTIRGIFHHVGLAIMKYFRLKPYEIQQSLESLAAFWAAVANRSRTLDEYKGYFEEE